MSSPARRILVVDDSVDDFEVASRLLKRGQRACEIEHIQYGSRFLASDHSGYDCVLLDLALPDKTGIDVIRELKSANRGSMPIPLIMLTGSSDDASIGEEAVGLGAQDYLSKENLSAQALQRSVDFAITRFRMERRLRESEAEHRALAEKLRESEQRFRSVFENAVSGIVIASADRHLLQCNRSFAEMLGYSSAELVGKNSPELIHPEDRDENERRFARLRSGEINSFEAEIRFLRKNGDPVHAHKFVSRLSEGASQSSPTITVVNDITEKKAREQELQASEQRYRSLAEKMDQAANAAGLGFWSWNAETGKVDDDEKNRSLLGLASSKSPTYDDFMDRVDERDRATLTKAIDLSLKSGRAYDTEFRIKKDNRWIAARGSVIRNDEGRITGIRGISIDVSKRKTVEEELRLSQEKFSLAFAQNPAAIALTQLHDGKYLEVNETLCRLTGHPASELLGKGRSALDIWPSEEEAQRFVRELEEKGQIRGWEQCFRNKNGGTLTSELSAQLLEVDGKKLVLSTLIDITDRKHAEEAIRKAQTDLEARVTERTSELADALKQLESQIAVRKEAEQNLRLLSARLLRAQDDERRRIARELHDSIGQTLTALKMGLAFIQQKIQSNKYSPDLFNDPNSLVDQSLSEVRTISHLLHPPLLDEVGFESAAKWYVEEFQKRSGIKIAVKLDRVDLSREGSLVLFRILQESLGNVLRHSGAKTADVTLTQNADGVQMCVCDYGKGMPQEKLEQFARNGTGLGVGMAGMMERVKQIRGSLTFSSTSAGTTVRVKVPASSDSAE